LAPAAARASIANFGMAVQPDGKIVVVGAAGHAAAGGHGGEAGAVVRYKRDGGLDRSFGKGGVVIARTVGPFTAVALQPDGRILLTSPIGQLSRLLPDGNLDPSFGVGGIAPAGTLSAYYPTDVAVERDRSILVGGTTGYLNDPGEHLYGRLYRYTPDGRSSEWIGSMTPSTGQNDPKSSLSDFLIGPSGSVIAAGSVGPRPPAPARSHAALARVVPNAGGFPDAQDKPDPSFGGGLGLVESNFFPSSELPESANALAQSRRGGLLIAGQAEGSLLLARYSRGGILDTRFGRGGAALTDVHGAALDSANAVAVQRNGKIVVAGGSGYGCPVPGCASLVVARYKASGRLDHGFGAKGIVSPRVDAGGYGTSATEVAYGVANQGREGILVGGLFAGGKQTRLVLRRYLADGAPDRTFGDGGRVATLPFRVARK
jgi:uncharacterized delta-60 repeat protein